MHLEKGILFISKNPLSRDAKVNKKKILAGREKNK